MSAQRRKGDIERGFEEETTRRMRLMIPQVLVVALMRVTRMGRALQVKGQREKDGSQPNPTLKVHLRMKGK